MSLRNLTMALLLAGLMAVAAACGRQATPDVNQAVQTALAETRAAEAQIAQAVAATLTASAPQATAAPAAQATNTAESTPTSAPQPIATPTPVRVAISPVDGDDGNDFLRGSNDENNGRVILLPGLSQAEIDDTPTFRDFINFRVEVFDTRAGLYDGAGIDHVAFRIIADDGQGDVVWEKEELNPAFCVFGGDDAGCSAIDLSGGAQWPAPFAGQINNNVYLAEIDIVPDQGEPTQWRWRFFIDSPDLAAAQPEAAPNTARINDIWILDGRYFVDFEAFGFTPQMPGQHLHFFFDSVPLLQAGAPGSGPWQIYPAANGLPATNPFTLLTVANRPPNANQMCILVANADHSVNQGTGNCVELP
ncbi:MAG TPA: hypothetical protein PKM78_09515 [Anaerolineae bacterium]|nr:hypothetical protein [Anaerolineae bacterium]HNU04136.1 hypothetical protein [Anaerolineae bacterium]